MELIQNRISQYKELSVISKEHEESIDVIVPDVNPDALNIIYTWGSCSVREKQAGPGSVTVSGDIFIRVLYTSEEEGRVYNLSGQIPYSYNYEAPGALSGDTLVVSAQILNASASALNPRKLTLRASMGLDARLFQPSAIEIVEGVYSEPEDGVKTRTRCQDWTYLGVVPEKKIAFNEEIRMLSGNVSDTDKIVRSELTWSAEDIKVLTNKIMLRGNASVKVITMPEGMGAAVENTYRLPFSQIIEAEGIEQDDSVEVEFQTLQFDTQFVTRGDNELYLYCNIFGSAALFVEKNATLTILEDMYSTTYNMSFDTTEVPGGCEELAVLHADATGLIELEAPAVQVLDFSWCARARSTAEGISASYYFKVIYENQNGGVNSALRRIDVEIACENLLVGSNVRAGAEMVSVGVDAVGSIQISFRAAFRAKKVCQTPGRQVKSCKLDRETPRGRTRDASLVLRAIEEGESAWSIAKVYRTSPDAILAANKLDHDADLTAGRLVIIPFVQ